MIFFPTSCIRITTLCSWLGEVAMTLVSNVTVAYYILYLYRRAYTYILLENPEKLMNFYMPLSMFILLLNLNPFACVFWSNAVGNICFMRNPCITSKKKSPQKNRQPITQDLYFWWNMDSLRIAISGMIELHSVFLLNSQACSPGLGLLDNNCDNHFLVLFSLGIVVCILTHKALTKQMKRLGRWCIFACLESCMLWPS